MPRPAVLDVGTGTGMFATALAEERDARIVVGVDPSLAMLQQAKQRSRHRRVHYVAGEASSLPVAETTIDLALLSRVIHHLSNRPRCVSQLRRVLRPGGIVVVPTTSREHLDALVYNYWPKLRDKDAARFPSRVDLLKDFTVDGFATIDVTSFD